MNQSEDFITKARRSILPKEEHRQQVIEILDLMKSGYAGVNRLGFIVDRRDEPDAAAYPENLELGIPKPKYVS